MTRSWRALAAPVALVFAVTLGACGSSSKKSTSSSGSSSNTTSAGGAGATGGTGAAATITISGFAFTPPTVPAKAGEKVTITNKDGTEHTVTADDSSFNADVKGDSATITAPSKPGLYKFHCNIHTTMHGQLVVS